MLYHLTCRLAAKRTSPHIASQRDAAPALGLDGIFRRHRIAVFAQINDGDICALAGEQQCDRPADTGIAAGDQRNLAVQFA
jgi:hypothetical protein